MTLREILARLEYALEALGDGDALLACAVLLDLRDGLLGEGDDAPRLACYCGARFRWPGELDHHRRFSHEAAA